MFMENLLKKTSLIKQICVKLLEPYLLLVNSQISKIILRIYNMSFWIKLIVMVMMDKLKSALQQVQALWINKNGWFYSNLQQLHLVNLQVTKLIQTLDIDILYN